MGSSRAGTVCGAAVRVNLSLEASRGARAGVASVSFLATAEAAKSVVWSTAFGGMLEIAEGDMLATQILYQLFEIELGWNVGN